MSAHTDPVTRYARLADHIQTVILPDTRGRDVQFRLRAMLEYTLGEIPALLRANLVYLVANHAELVLAGGRRHFVAAMNWKLVRENGDAAVRFIRAQPKQQSETVDERSCVLDFFGDPPPPKTAAKICAFWAAKWQVYWKTTREGEVRSHFTWNQLLLQTLAHPRPLGLSWGPGKAGSHYFNLSKRAATSIGIPDVRGGGLLSLSARQIEEVIAEKGYALRELESLRQLFAEIYPGERWQADRVAWAIFHLLKDYGFWGGTAFLSLPVTMGSMEGARCAVLSLCTVRPLPQSQVTEWALIASALLRPLVEEEWDQQIRHYSHADQSFDFAHFIKNRTAPLASALKRLKRDSDLAATLAGATPEHAKALAEIAEGIVLAQRCWNTLSVAAELLDVHARAMRSQRREGTFLDVKRGWSTTDPFVFGPDLGRACAEPRALGDTQVVRVGIDPSAIRLRIEPWITLSSETCLPAHKFYAAILDEIVINAAGHCCLEETEVRLRFEGINFETTRGLPAAVFSNDCNSFVGTEKLGGLALGQWHRFHGSGHGGLSHLARLATTSGIAQGVYIRMDPAPRPGSPDGMSFHVAIAFSGLHS